LYSEGEITISNINGFGLIASGSVDVSLKGPVTISGCSNMGFYISRTSSASVSSVLHVADCFKYGIGIARGSSLYNYDTANILVTGTQQPWGVGIGVWENAIWRANGGTIRSDSNTGHGIEIWRNATISLRELGTGIFASSENNSGNGVNISQQGSLRTDESFAVNNNTGNGIAISGNSECRLIALAVQGNGERGINAFDGSSITINDSTISTNTGGDIVLGFGSRANLWNNNYGTTPVFSCDSSVLTIGDTICP